SINFQADLQGFPSWVSSLLPIQLSSSLPILRLPPSWMVTTRGGSRLIRLLTISFVIHALRVIYVSREFK
ncbi:hypothetical protein LINGRAHAP2_LOCUS11848, partial [Linum grandiflorum]